MRNIIKIINQQNQQVVKNTTLSCKVAMPSVVGWSRGTGLQYIL